MDSSWVIVLAVIVLLSTLLSMIILVRHLLRVFDPKVDDSSRVLVGNSSPDFRLQTSFKPDCYPYFRVLEECDLMMGEEEYYPNKKGTSEVRIV